MNKLLKDIVTTAVFGLLISGLTLSACLYKCPLGADINRTLTMIQQAN